MGEPTLSVMSFGFARGLPRNADLVFDMRFLRNPHWVRGAAPGHRARRRRRRLCRRRSRPMPRRWRRSRTLLLLLLPRYRAEGKSYVTVAFGCTGGRHRSVHVAERIAARLRDAGFSPTVDASRPRRRRRRTRSRSSRPAHERNRECRDSMIGLVLVTHGRLAEEFVTAMEHVVGKQERDRDDLHRPRGRHGGAPRRHRRARSREVDDGSGVIVLTDLFGGTPSNLAISLMERGRGRGDRRASTCRC